MGDSSGAAVERFQAGLRDRPLDSARGELVGDPLLANLVELVERHQRVGLLGVSDSCRIEKPGQHQAMIQADHEIAEAQSREHLADRAQLLGLHDRRSRADRVDVALVELPETPPRRTIRPPDRLDLIALEEPRQLVLVLRDDARQRHRQIVAKGEIRLAGSRMLAPAQDLENEPVPLLAVFAKERLDVLERRRLERLEPVLLVDTAHDADDILAAADVVREKIACSPGWLG